MDKVYFFEYEDFVVECLIYYEVVVDCIVDVVGFLFDVEYLDFFDMYEVMGVVMIIVDWYFDDFVCVNVIVGIKCVVVGVMMVCMDEYIDVELYVVDFEVWLYGFDVLVMEGFV